MIDPEVYARAKMPAGPRGEYQPSTTPYRRDQNMNVGIPEIREALRSGSMTRDELAAHFRTGRAVVAKPIYNLIQSGEAIEEGGRISLLRRDLPSKPSEAPESHPSTTQGEKIDSRAVSGPAKGMDGEGLMLAIADATKSYVSGLVAERDELAARVEELERKLAAVREAVGDD